MSVDNKPDSKRPNTSCQEQLIEDTLLSQQYRGVPASRWKDETHSPSNLCYTVLQLPHRNSIFVFVPGLVPNQFTTITWPQLAPYNAPRAGLWCTLAKDTGSSCNKSCLLKALEAFSPGEFSCIWTLSLYMHTLTGKLLWELKRELLKLV